MKSKEQLKQEFLGRIRTRQNEYTKLHASGWEEEKKTLTHAQQTLRLLDPLHLTEICKEAIRLVESKEFKSLEIGQALTHRFISQTCREKPNGKDKRLGFGILYDYVLNNNNQYELAFMLIPEPKSARDVRQVQEEKSTIIVAQDMEKKEKESRTNSGISKKVKFAVRIDNEEPQHYVAASQKLYQVEEKKEDSENTISRSIGHPGVMFGTAGLPYRNKFGTLKKVTYYPGASPDLGPDLLYFLMKIWEGKIAPSPTEKDLTFIAYQLLDLFQAVHEKGFLHNDPKSENILICDHYIIKLTDFGVANRHQKGIGALDFSNIGIGTPGHWSPEKLLNFWRRRHPKLTLAQLLEIKELESLKTNLKNYPELKKFLIHEKLADYPPSSSFNSIPAECWGIGNIISQIITVCNGRDEYRDLCTELLVPLRDGFLQQEVKTRTTLIEAKATVDAYVHKKGWVFNINLPSVPIDDLNKSPIKKSLILFCFMALSNLAGLTVSWEIYSYLLKNEILLPEAHLMAGSIGVLVSFFICACVKRGVENYHEQPLTNFSTFLYFAVWSLIGFIACFKIDENLLESYLSLPGAELIPSLIGVLSGMAIGNVIERSGVIHKIQQGFFKPSKVIDALFNTAASVGIYQTQKSA